MNKNAADKFRSYPIMLLTKLVLAVLTVLHISNSYGVELPSFCNNEWELCLIEPPTLSLWGGGNFGRTMTAKTLDDLQVNYTNEINATAGPENGFYIESNSPYTTPYFFQSFWPNGLYVSSWASYEHWSYGTNPYIRPVHASAMASCPFGYVHRTLLPLPGICLKHSVEFGLKTLDLSCSERVEVGDNVLLNGLVNVHKEQDYNGSADSLLSFTRTYVSKRAHESKIFTGGWLTNYDMRIAVATISSTPQVEIVDVMRPSGAILRFKKQTDESYSSEADVNSQLTAINGDEGTFSWAFYDAKTNRNEIYNAQGLIEEIKSPSGLVLLSFTYSDNSTNLSVAPESEMLIKVSDYKGNELKFSYGIQNRLEKVMLPDGSAINYFYETEGALNGSLTEVHYSNATKRKYQYDTIAVSGFMLTGITDEKNIQYASWDYERDFNTANTSTVGDAISSSNVDGINSHSIDVVSGNTRTITVTDARESQRIYRTQLILGVRRLVGQDQPAGAGCAASGSNITYDANGNVDTKTDFNGNLTKYHYDMSRNLETTRVEGLDTAGNAQLETRTVTTSWHPNWRLPEVVSEYNGDADSSGNPQGTLLRETTTVYDDKGNITSISINDPINNTVRTTTTTYTYSSDVPGLILTKEVDGPRTDVSDITTYDYYPHDATCAESTATPIVDPITNTSPENYGCRGQLQTMTNALGHQTTYDRYNHHGQIEQMTDPNGLVTEYTYDLRQRMTSTTKGTELTNYQYDAVGQLDILTLPDGTQLDYDYDAAHRLTDIRDNQGNHIHYSLDSMGNREQEDIYDPQGALTKTISRGYDALNRLETLTGID